MPTKDTLFGVLIATFTKCKGNSDTFKALPEVQNIAKLLHRYYEHDSPFHLGSDSMIYYPCNKGNYPIKNDGCKYFNVYNRIYQHAIFCDLCTEGNIAEVRKQIVSYAHLQGRDHLHHCLRRISLLLTGKRRLQ